MTEKDIKIAGTVMGAFILGLVVIAIILYQQVNAQTRSIDEIKASFADMQAENQKILAYLDNYHGSDKERDLESARIKLLLEDHEAKIYNIVKTINELH